MNAEVIKAKGLAMAVCVPSGWTDEQIKEFADGENPAGTQNGWHVRKEGDECLRGTPERVPCSSRIDFVHVTLGC